MPTYYSLLQKYDWETARTWQECYNWMVQNDTSPMIAFKWTSKHLHPLHLLCTNYKFVCFELFRLEWNIRYHAWDVVDVYRIIFQHTYYKHKKWCVKIEKFGRQPKHNLVRYRNSCCYSTSSLEKFGYIAHLESWWMNLDIIKWITDNPAKTERKLMP